MSELPKGWVEAEVGSLCDLINGKAFKPTDWSPDGLPIVRIQNLNKPDAPYNCFSGDVDPKFMIEDGQLLFAWSGTPGTSFGAHVWHGGIAVLNQHIFKVNFDDAHLHRHFFKTAINFKLEELIGKAHGGVGLRHVTKGKFEETKLPLPPLAEQKRIVAKLDALSVCSSRARKDLARIDTLVKRYKQAVLSKAFSGELTKDWRDQNTGASIEPTLSAVRQVRSKSKKLARRKRSIQTPDLPLPAGWSWISPDEVASNEPYSIGIGPFGSNLVKADYQERGVRLIFVRDIRAEKFDLENAVFVSSEKADELHQHQVSGNELLITKMGDPPGDTAIYPEGQGVAIITADCIKLKAHPLLSSSGYLGLAIRTTWLQEQIASITKGVAHQKVSLDRFRQLALPIAPLDEQKEIVRRIESAFLKIDKLAAEAKRALELTDKLDEAILAKAFRGDLVPQDPTDEPASVLLDRIKAERAVAPKPKRGRRKKN
ncbi:restriction endonuclease subunit S [Roseibium sp. RP-7]